MQFNGETLDKFRLKLRNKVRYHVGGVCPDVEDIVQETLVRFLRLAEDDRIRSPGNLGGLLNGVCNNVILEYRRRLWREERYEPEFREDRHPAVPEAELMEVREAVDVGWPSCLNGITPSSDLSTLRTGLGMRSARLWASLTLSFASRCSGRRRDFEKFTART
jgi:DNA-directed RNA polymerase specialized sigma24 family protein